MPRNALNVFQRDIFVEHYHCDNGCFSAKAFIDDFAKKGQTISNCAIYGLSEMERQKRPLKMYKKWQGQCCYMPKQYDKMQCTYPFGHMQ